MAERWVRSAAANRHQRAKFQDIIIDAGGRWVMPGFVDTPMTAHLPKGPLFAPPEAVARAIVRAVRRRRDVVYAPGFWRAIMLVIRSIPERIFKRLSL